MVVDKVDLKYRINNKLNFSLTAKGEIRLWNPLINQYILLPSLYLEFIKYFSNDEGITILEFVNQIKLSFVIEENVLPIIIGNIELLIHCQLLINVTNDQVYQIVDDLEKVKKPIFIVGSPRSGTTLLLSLLSCNDNILTISEGHLIETFGRDARLYLNESNSNINKLLVQTGLSSKALFKAYSKAYEYLSHTLCRQYNKKRIAEKSCYLFKSINQIDSIFEHDVHWVWLLRNPYEVVLSMKRVDIKLENNKEGNISDYAKMWKNQNKQVGEFEKKNSNRVYRIYYEQLVNKTQSIMDQLFDFLGEKKVDNIDNVYKYVEQPLCVGGDQECLYGDRMISKKNDYSLNENQKKIINSETESIVKEFGLF